VRHGLNRTAEIAIHVLSRWHHLARCVIYPCHCPVRPSCPCLHWLVPETSCSTRLPFGMACIVCLLLEVGALQLLAFWDSANRASADQVWGRLCARSSFASSFAGRPAPTEALARTGVQHSCSSTLFHCRPQGGPTGSVHRFRGSAPQIKSGAGSAREALSPAGRLPHKHWLAPACNTVAPANMPRCNP